MKKKKQKKKKVNDKNSKPFLDVILILIGLEAKKQQEKTELISENIKTFKKTVTHLPKNIDAASSYSPEVEKKLSSKMNKQSKPKTARKTPKKANPKVAESILHEIIDESMKNLSE
jgi:hypothetical protein